MKKMALLLWLCGGLGFFIHAQPLDMNYFKAIKPRSIGPASMSGRVTAIDVVRSNPDVIYIGTASGGVWRSTSGGITWEPLFDGQPVMAIGSIAINQSNPDDIWVGTGEGNPRNSLNTGEGIFRSLDGGKTWKYMGLKETKTIHRIIINRDNPNIVHVAALGSPFGPNPERGVFRTKDGGKTWEKVLFTNDQSGCAEMVVDPSNPNKLIAGMWEHSRKPWFFTSGGPGSGIYVTHDGGDTWQKRTEADGLPKGPLGRTGLAISRSKPNIVYALVEAEENGLYKSTDGGQKFSLVTKGESVSDRPFYYHELYVDPQNENRIFNLYSSLSKSEDGGKTFQTFRSRLHADHHAFYIHPDNPRFIVEGNDGGLNISRDGGDTWVFSANLPLGQFYHVNYDMSIPYRVGGGLQDNGSWVGPNTVWEGGFRAGGIRNHHWKSISGGDGFDVGFRPDNGRYAYAMSQGGALSYIDLEAGRSQTIRPTHPDKNVELRFNWNAAFAQDPFVPTGIYYGSQFLHYSKDNGQTWELLSPDLTTNDTSKQRKDTGGLTMDATNAENHTTILAIAPSTVDAKVIWVGTDDGNLQLTRDAGKTWTNLASRLPGVKPGSWIPYIELSQKNAGEAFVIVNDYRRNDYRPMAFHTTDFGATFKQIADEKKVQGHALSIVQDPEAPNLLWLGTDYGLYVTIDGGATWTKWMNGYPSVPTYDMKIHPRDQDLIIATFGRSLYILDDIRPFREIAKSGAKIMEQPFKVFSAGDAYLVQGRISSGENSTADAMYFGEAEQRGAVISVWSKPSAAPPMGRPGQPGGRPGMGPGQPGAPQPAAPGARPGAPGGMRQGGAMAGRAGGPNARVIVFDMQGDTVRSFETPVDSGLTRIVWPLNRNGVQLPRRETPGGAGGGGFAAFFAGGGIAPAVMPGTYKVVVINGRFRDSTMVTVKPDPMLDIPMAEYQAKEAAFKEMVKVIQAANEGWNRLQEVRNTVRRVDAAMGLAPDSTKQQLARLGKSLQDSVAAMENLYMMPTGLKGIQRSADNINGMLQGALSYLNASNGGPNQAAQRMMERARERVAGTLEKINAFMAKDFAAYQQKVQAAQAPMFKAMEPLKMN
ncbi:MAG: hypothetical protein KIPDCIKN_02127 [Haliscomenobacter sp.]|nr:hypothetical protein [Haliscomenobacter sp.]